MYGRSHKTFLAFRGALFSLRVQSHAETVQRVRHRSVGGDFTFRAKAVCDLVSLTNKTFNKLIRERDWRNV